MKAIRVQQFGEPEVLELVEVADLAPRPGQILVRIQAAGVNPVETYIRSGKYARLPDLPYSPGTDGAGTVAAVGAGVADWKIGDRVYTAGSLTGTYAEQALCEPAHLHPLPPAISFAQGAALGIPYVTAHIALFHRGQGRSGETLLVHGGTGGVGLAAIQIAHAAGLRVLATGGTDAGRELVRRQGADGVFNHHAPDYTQHILEATEGHGVDLILELLANVNLGKDLPLLAPFGRVAVVGSRGPVEINPRDLMARNADIRGVIGFGLPSEVLQETHRALVAGLEKGDLQPVIAREFPLAEAAAAHRAVMASGAMGKIVLRFS
ncbi:MAG TPA: NADPH:quinone reductase [Chthoniobacter sp.]|jgi:NADPH2:quinone reductase